MSNLSPFLKASTDGSFRSGYTRYRRFHEKDNNKRFRLVKFTFDLILSVQRAIYELHIEGWGTYSIPNYDMCDDTVHMKHGKNQGGLWKAMLIRCNYEKP